MQYYVSSLLSVGGVGLRAECSQILASNLRVNKDMIVDILVFGPLSLIKNNTQAAVTNIVKRIFRAWRFECCNIHLQKQYLVRKYKTICLNLLEDWKLYKEKI